jgi:hypothetical protein
MKTLALIMAALCLAIVAHASSTINVTNRYAYGANVAWIDWRGDDGTNGAVIGEFVCSGYIYGANIGWIHLGNGSPTNHVQYSNTVTNDYGVNHDGAGNLSGYAYGANVGWLNFTNVDATGSPFAGPKVDLLTGNLSGCVYGANIGWISLSNASAFVKTDSLDSGPDADGDGIPDSWEYLYAGNLSTMNATTENDGDGKKDIDEYVADTDPFDASDYLRITALSVNSGGSTSTVTWTSHPTRLYQVQSRDDLTAGLWATNVPPGLVSPDVGATTTRVVPGVAATKRFHRVQAIRPLSP